MQNVERGAACDAQVPTGFVGLSLPSGEDPRAGYSTFRYMNNDNYWLGFFFGAMAVSVFIGTLMANNII